MIADLAYNIKCFVIFYLTRPALKHGLLRTIRNMPSTPEGATPRVFPLITADYSRLSLSVLSSHLHRDTLGFSFFEQCYVLSSESLSLCPLLHIYKTNPQARYNTDGISSLQLFAKA